MSLYIKGQDVPQRGAKRPALPPPPSGVDGEQPGVTLVPTSNPTRESTPRPLLAYPYSMTPQGIFRQKMLKGGPVTERLANFAAVITADVVFDNGADEVRHYEIESWQGNRTWRFSVQAEQFAHMTWAAPNLGASAFLFPGSGFRDHARTAIQMCSPSVLERRVYTHTGWRQLDTGEWVFVHAGGAIGGGGPATGVSSQIDGPLELYALPEPPPASELADPVRELLTVLLAVAPETIMVPLMGCAFRAVFGDVDFSASLCGPTGKGKSQLAALAQQHFGRAMDDGHLPGNWSSTANALEEIAFRCKDVLLVIDDFKSQGTHGENSRLHREADRLLRGAANGSGRNRMRPDTTLRPPHQPRAMILSTGEEPFRGQSLNARVLTVEVGEGDVDWDALTLAQGRAADGLLAQVMASFISHLADRYDERRSRFQGYRERLTDRARAGALGSHKQTPGQVANLAAGWEMFLDFAAQAGALTGTERDEYSERVWEALAVQAAAQGRRVIESDPVVRFLNTISSLLSTRRAHLVVHDDPGQYPDGRVDEEWGGAEGELLGYVTDDGIYLDPAASLSAVERLLSASGEGLGASERALRKGLQDGGYLMATGMDGVSRETLSIRRSFGGRRGSWLHLRRDALSAE